MQNFKFLNNTKIWVNDWPIIFVYTIQSPNTLEFCTIIHSGTLGFPVSVHTKCWLFLLEIIKLKLKKKKVLGTNYRGKVRGRNVDFIFFFQWSLGIDKARRRWNWPLEVSSVIPVRCWLTLKWSRGEAYTRLSHRIKKALFIFLDNREKTNHFSYMSYRCLTVKYIC